MRAQACVLVQLRAWQRVYVWCALFVLLHAYLCVIELYEMETTGMGLHGVGVVVQ